MNVFSKTVWNTANSLNKLANKVKRVTLVWIKAHVGYEGNKRADLLARESTESETKNTMHEANNHTKQRVKEQIYEEWQSRWNTEPTCRQTKQFFPKIEKRNSAKILKLARSQLSTLISITTGHNNLSYHASIQDPTIDPMCVLCGEERETFFHFVTTCPRLRESRESVFLDKHVPDTWTPEGLLEFARIPAVETLLDS